jgi:transcriptional regulator with XRE-family HTH domain
MTLAERLKKARKCVEASQPEMAKLLGISKPAWQGYELGKSEPGSGVIKELTKIGFDANWLLTGEGLMRKVDRDTFNIPLLAVIIEALEEYEKDFQKKLTPEEKANFISTACDMCLDDEATSDLTNDKIKQDMKNVFDFSTHLDLMIKTKRGRKQAIKLLTRDFKNTISKVAVKKEVEEFISSRITKLKSKKAKNKKPL